VRCVDTAKRVHTLINSKRRRRGLRPVYWSRGCADYAQSSADSCARLGQLVHARLLNWDGGENLAFSSGRFTPRAIVNRWMRSAGHRENLLNPQATMAGVGATRTGKGTYVAWIFSRMPPTYPDCPGYRVRRKGGGFFRKIVRILFGK
jgi:uncharacterized protein YkwD